MELDLIPPQSEWKDVFYQADDDFTPGICIEAKSGALSWSSVNITKSIVCSPDEGPDDSCVVTHNDLVETEIEIHDGNPYFVAESLMTVSVCQLPTELVLASTTQLNVYRLMLIYFWYTYNYVFYMCLLFHRPTEGLKREDHRVMNIIKQRGYLGTLYAHLRFRLTVFTAMGGARKPQQKLDQPQWYS